MEERTTSKKNQTASFYSHRIQEFEQTVKLLSKKAKVWVAVRLISFLAIPLIIYFTFELGSISFIAGIIALILFLFFVRKSAENKEALFLARTLLSINQNELSLIEKNDYQSFENGEKYKNAQHPFSYDMDVYGEKGCFQYLNRTVSPIGEKKLSDILNKGTGDIEADQQAIEELSEHIAWTQEYRARGIVQQNDQPKWATSKGWGEKETDTKIFMRIGVFLMPFISIPATILYNFDYINGLQFFVIFAIVLIPVLNRLKKTNKITGEMSHLTERIKVMSEQLNVLSQINFSSPKLASFQAELFKNESNAQDAIKQLTKITKQAEYRNNVLVAIALNFYFAWDFKVILAVASWKQKYGEQLNRWENILFDFEVLISGANFRFNRKDETIYPTLSTENDHINLLALGHPLIPKDKLVCNDYVMESGQQFSIITGPNMAGKSTFLRSVGVNLMLAKAGFPVLAKTFVFPNVALYSSMRTADDLSNESSYFHAELVRLRFIVDAIERGEKVFIILDEILKGTNSKDKEEGSAQFLLKLVSLKAQGIIATHDLKLTELAHSNRALKNIYFDTTISGEDISFDYKLNDGVAHNMNASFLLRKMGLVDAEKI